MRTGAPLLVTCTCFTPAWLRKKTRSAEGPWLCGRMEVQRVVDGFFCRRQMGKGDETQQWVPSRITTVDFVDGLGF